MLDWGGVDIIGTGEDILRDMRRICKVGEAVDLGLEGQFGRYGGRGRNVRIDGNFWFSREEAEMLRG